MICYRQCESYLHSDYSHECWNERHQDLNEAQSYQALLDCQQLLVQGPPSQGPMKCIQAWNWLIQSHMLPDLMPMGKVFYILYMCCAFYVVLKFY